MCRFLMYLGPPLPMEDLVTLPSNSLIHQSYAAKLRKEPLNGDGFGIAWYVPTMCDRAAVFRSISPAWSNVNLANLARVTISGVMMAHVRAASPGLPVSETNCHPFSSGKYTFMHNGFIADFAKVRRRLQNRLSDRAYEAVYGTTDSENTFGLFLDAIEDTPHTGADALAHGLRVALATVTELHAETGSDEACMLNLAVTDGQTAAISRHTTGGDEANSLYVHTGKRYLFDGEVCRMVDPDEEGGAVIVASEPLSEDPGWEEVPLNHLVTVDAQRHVEIVPV